MIRYNRGILLGNRGILLGDTIRWRRFCRLAPGHRGQHEVVYLGDIIRFDTPHRSSPVSLEEL